MNETMHCPTCGDVKSINHVDGLIATLDCGDRVQMTTKRHADIITREHDSEWDEFLAGDWEVEPETIEPVVYAGFDSGHIGTLAERRNMTADQYLDYIADMREQLIDARFGA